MKKQLTATLLAMTLFIGCSASDKEPSISESPDKSITKIASSTDGGASSGKEEKPKSPDKGSYIYKKREEWKDDERVQYYSHEERYAAFDLKRDTTQEQRLSMGITHIVDGQEYNVYNDVWIKLNTYLIVPKNPKERHSANTRAWNASDYGGYCADFPLDAVDEYIELVDYMMAEYVNPERNKELTDRIDIGARDGSKPKTNKEKAENAPSEYQSEVSVSAYLVNAKLRWPWDDKETTAAMLDRMHASGRNLLGFTKEQMAIYEERGNLVSDVNRVIGEVVSRTGLDRDKALNT